MGLKIAVIGAAGSYTPELFANLYDYRDRLQVDQVVLMDPSTEKLNLIADVSRKVVSDNQMGIQVVTTQNRLDAMSGADCVIMQIRVGGSAARIRDEQLPMKFNLIGNETTGAGGFISALRTVPVLVDVARELEQVAPNAWLMNLNNPGGILTEAVLKYSKANTVGFCNIPINTQYAFARLLRVSPEKVVLDSFGLNHLSWVREVYVDGQPMLKPLIEKAATRRAKLYTGGLVESLTDPELLQMLGMIPSWYLRYFYYTEQVLKMDRRSKYLGGEHDIQADNRIKEIFATEGYNQEARQILNSKGGAQYYLPVLQVLDSILHDRNEIVIADVRNGTTITDLPQDAAVEVPAHFGKNGIKPVPIGALPLQVRGLVQAIKTFEELTIQAAMSGDRKLALEALMANPLVGSYSKAKVFFDCSLEFERPYLPLFFQ